MSDHNMVADFLRDQDLMELFDRVARENGTTAQKVLSSFIKDYIVSGGHPELVPGKPIQCSCFHMRER